MTTPPTNGESDAVGNASTSSATMEFARDLHALFAAAGDPTLTSVVSAVKPVAAVSRQRLSNWRAGRHLPARFADIEPVLAHLINAAQASSPPASRDQSSTAGPAGLLSLDVWEDRWESATTAAQAGPPAPLAAPTVLYRGLSKPVALIVIGLLVFFVALLAAAAAIISTLL